VTSWGDLAEVSRRALRALLNPQLREHSNGVVLMLTTLGDAADTGRGARVDGGAKAVG
jgi:hypothetical protein